LRWRGRRCRTVLITLSTIYRFNAVVTYLKLFFDLVNPTPKPTARPTMMSSTISAIRSTLVHPPLFATCLLFLKSENFSPLGPVTLSYSPPGGGPLLWKGMNKRGTCRFGGSCRMSGCIPPCSSMGPRRVAAAARRWDGLVLGLTTGPAPVGLE
jgi:hypothetical protein